MQKASETVEFDSKHPASHCNIRRRTTRENTGPDLLSLVLQEAQRPLTEVSTSPLDQ